MNSLTRSLAALSILGASVLASGSARADSTVTGLITSISRGSYSGTIKIAGTSLLYNSTCAPWFGATDVQTLATAAQNGTTVSLSYTLVMNNGVIGYMCVTQYEIKP